MAAPPPEGFALEVETLIVGAGAGGLSAALAARERGEEVLVVERDPAPGGSTALSAGLIPAAGTRLQREAGVEDDAATFAEDIQRKARGEAHPALTEALARGAAPTVDALTERYGLPFELVDGFTYPGHSRRRMHGLPSRTGRELLDRLRAAAEAAGVEIVCGRVVRRLFAEPEGRVAGVEAEAPDGTAERVGCGRLILACSGFGGDAGLVARHVPAAAGALYFGHPGNRGDALRWGEALGAATRDLGAWQGHGSVAHPHGILITWATMAEGGLLVDRGGRRFTDESQGYSEAAAPVLTKAGGVAFAIFDGRIAAVARQFEDFRAAEAAGAVKAADTAEALAAALGLPGGALSETLAEAEAARASGEADGFGRRFGGPGLAAPFLGVRVTGALFHTQGGLDVDGRGRVRRAAGGLLPNLFAVGGAACGVSGSADHGYLSGNGLLSAVVLGRLAGSAAG